MFGPDGIFSERRRGLWLLVCGSSWMLLFIYGTLKFLWMHEWGYACVTGGVIACGPLGAALTIWSRSRRMRAAAAREAREAELEAQLDRAERTPVADATTRVPVMATRPSVAPVE